MVRPGCGGEMEVGYLRSNGHSPMYWTRDKKKRLFFSSYMKGDLLLAHDLSTYVFPRYEAYHCGKCKIIVSKYGV